VVLAGADGLAGSGDGADRLARLPEGRIGAGSTAFVPEPAVQRPDRARVVAEVDGTISFVDISGFTAMSERLSNIGRAGAEEVTDVMNATFSALLDVAAKVARRSPPPSKSTVSPFGQCRRSRIDYRGGRC